MFEVIFITLLVILCITQVIIPFIQLWCDMRNEAIFGPSVDIDVEFFDIDYDKSIEKTFIGIFDDLSQCPKDCPENSMVDIFEFNKDADVSTCTIYIYTSGEWRQYSRRTCMTRRKK